MGKYKLISLEYCPYSRNAEEIFKNSTAKYELVKVTSNTKKEYKTKFISTFPQIFYEELLIGGVHELKMYINDPEKEIKPLNNVGENQIKKCRKSINKRFNFYL